MSPAIAIILRDIGCERLIVGRHAWDMVLDPAIASCGDQSGIDYEVLLGVKPDIILTQWGSRAPPERLTRLTEEHGWELIDLSLLSLDEVIQSTEALERRFEAWRDPGDPFPSQRLRDIGRNQPTRPEIGRVLLLASVNPPAAVGPGSFHDDILRRLGATPAINRGGPYIDLDAEDVLALAPDAIVIIAPREPRSAPAPSPTSDDLLARLGPLASLNIPAIASGHIALIDHPLAHTPSTALADFAAELDRILDQWQR